MKSISVTRDGLLNAPTDNFKTSKIILECLWVQLNSLSTSPGRTSVDFCIQIRQYLKVTKIQNSTSALASHQDPKFNVNNIQLYLVCSEAQVLHKCAKLRVAQSNV